MLMVVGQLLAGSYIDRSSSRLPRTVRVLIHTVRVLPRSAQESHADCHVPIETVG
jgi:hypothetical protein